MTQKNDIIKVEGIPIAVVKHGEEDYISLTDIARRKNPREPKDVVKNWMRVRSTIDFLTLWEQVNNPRFEGVEIDPLRLEAGTNAFTLSPSRWITLTNAVGLISRRGANGGTFAHIDIALEFAAWVNTEFKLYFITEFRRLKTQEQQQLSSEWNLQRMLAKINYRIHTDAIKEHIIPAEVTKEQANRTYASEADILNVALFGQTAAQWRTANPNAGKRTNMRDEATLHQLIVLSNMEGINAHLIEQGLPQKERLVQLNRIAITQSRSLAASEHIEALATG
ncbi:MAG: KilA-N domain-containing protein [Coriobacteriia bacterium]|nr:KilA-N domain-containing protein [Coriobacteriia bacterium]